MSVWALADLHLPFGNPAKSMEVFGWENYTQKIEKQWRAHVMEDDLILLPGDTSWAMRLEEAKPDLEWIDALPGKKVLLRGNHDYWWTSASKLKKVLPPSLHFIHNNAFDWEDVTIGGARLWDTKEYNFHNYVIFQENARASLGEFIEDEEREKVALKIFSRELERLRLSLKELNKNAKWRLAMTHYPPIGADLAPSLTSQLLEEFKIQIAVFGHLHSIKKDSLPFGVARGIHYVLASSDVCEFTPLLLLPKER